MKENSVGTTPTDFLTVGGRPLGFQRETVGKRLGFSGTRRVKGESRYLRATFFSSAFLPFPRASTPERTSGEPVFFESPAIGLLGLRIVILSRQPLDCWGSAFLELPAVGLSELRKVVQGERGKSAGKEKNLE